MSWSVCKSLIQIGIAFFLSIASSASLAATFRLCNNALVQQTPTQLSQVISSNIRTETVKNGEDEIETLIMTGVYPPYQYGHELLNQAKKSMRGYESVLILGIGTGYEAIDIRKTYPDVKIQATDISQRALLNAELNFAFHNANNIPLIQSDVFDNVDGEFDRILFHIPRGISEAELHNAHVDIQARFRNTDFFDLDYRIAHRFLRDLPKTPQCRWQSLRHAGSAIRMASRDEANLQNQTCTQRTMEPQKFKRGSVRHLRNKPITAKRFSSIALP